MTDNLFEQALASAMDNVGTGYDRRAMMADYNDILYSIGNSMMERAQTPTPKELSSEALT